MSEDFAFTGSDSKRVTGSANCHACPLALLPQNIWRNILKPPFRRRHPVIWWLCFIAIIAISFFAGAKAFSDSEGGGIDRIALVRISGPIMDVSPTLAWIRKLEHNPDVKGILLRVDSPGGGAAASQEIYAALMRVREKMPIAVSMGSTAASGGLMVSMAGERIYANPSTVTGSIGVRMDIPQLQGLMAKLGIGQETLTTAPFKDAASYTHAMTPADRAYLENLLMNMHDQFIDIVAKGRNMPREKAASLADGKIYTGQQAQELGLIDSLGGQVEAHEWLAHKTGIPAARKMLVRPVSKTQLLERLLSLAKVFGLDLQALSEAENFGSGVMQPIFLY